MHWTMFHPTSSFLCEVLQYVLVRIFNVFIGGVTHRSQDVHHGTHQLVGVSVRDETLRLFVSRHFGCHADAQRDVTRHPLDLVAIRRKSCGVDITFKIKSCTGQIIAQRFGKNNIFIIKTLKNRRRRMVDASWVDSTHTSRARALVSAQLICIFP